MRARGIKYSFFLLLLFCLHITAYSRNDPRVYARSEIYLEAEDSFRIYLCHPYSSLLLRTLENEVAGVFVRQGNQGFQLHVQAGIEKEEQLPSSFLFLNRKDAEIVFWSEENLHLSLELFDGLDPIPVSSLRRKKTDPCEEPDAVDQSIWRQGLPDPKPGRTTVEVKHCIIHHSTGSNQLNDFTTAVRAIYLYHLQSNGWDDIGYNYLVSPTGTIYKGRDPLGAGDQDNIQGAHFCSKNSGTMGICLIGTYSDTGISSEMYKGLTAILSWKLHKEGLSAFDQFPHPEEQSPLLGSIGFHRDGCNTQCPGDSVVVLMEQLKTEVQVILNQCQHAGFSDPQKKHSLTVYPNPSTGTVYIKSESEIVSIILINLQGQIRTWSNAASLVTLNVLPGIYFLEIKLEDGVIVRQKLIIIN